MSVAVNAPSSVAVPALTTSNWPALLPPIFAALLGVALEEGTALTGASARSGSRWWRWLAASGAGSLGLCLLAAALPSRLAAARELQNKRVLAAAGACPAVPGFAAETVAAWLGSLRKGSLWLAQREGDPLALCVTNQGLELSTPAPLGNTSAVGSHVGLLWLAAKQLEPERAGAGQRATALGVGYVLQTSKEQSPQSGFVRRNVSGSVELWENPAAGLAHVGCVRERWTGSDEALRARLARELPQPALADRLLDPERFIELVPGTGEVRVERVEPTCAPSAARLSAQRLEPGVLEARVEAEAPLELAFVATAFPGWEVSIDGARVPQRVIAPGYLMVRVERGRHRVLATAGTLPGYGFWLALGGLAIAALAWLQLPRQRVKT